MTTAAHTTPRALTAYLTRATWGLPEARRQELWDELEEHILTRADHLILSGLTPTQATAQAIRELGPPTRVTLGMAQVYTMPKLILTAATLALGISAGLYALAGGSQSLILPVQTERPVKPTCVRGTVPEHVSIVSARDGVTCFTYTGPTVPGAYLSFSSLRSAVTAAGGQVTQLDGSGVRVKLPASQFKLPSSFTAQNERYFLAAAVASEIMAVYPDAHLSGFAQPTIQFGGQRLTFGQRTQTIGTAFYGGLSLELLSSLLSPPSGATEFTLRSSGQETGPHQHRVLTTLPAGEVVMLVRRGAGSNYTFSVQPVATDRAITLSSSASRLRFVTDPAQLGPDPVNGHQTALLVRLSNIPLNDLQSGIFVPAQATSDAR
ncbi:permease prefix domain 1-containing protein [Deinococcus sp. JMULE3]|uniref:permease prefix domain 1-containing protein n=1 Tax=Deinococcus sp. JMULE3 TaxID=2518341 RepID=UPI001575CE7C|nr:hypothetical protein [Deinococcus sp. JMULE3]